MAYPGKHAGVFIDNNLVAEINDATFTINGEIVDISSFDSGGWRERLLNSVMRRSPSPASMPMGYRRPGGSSTAILTQALVEDVKVLADVNVATSGFICDAYVETFEINAAVEEP